jgi:hypothetical protein
LHKSECLIICLSLRGTAVRDADEGRLKENKKSSKNRLTVFEVLINSSNLKVKLTSRLQDAGKIGGQVFCPLNQGKTVSKAEFLAVKRPTAL